MTPKALEPVERVARAIVRVYDEHSALTGDGCGEVHPVDREAARAALEAMRPDTLNVKELCERIKQRLENEASQMNSAYDRFGMDNTPQSVDPDVFAMVTALEASSQRIKELEKVALNIEAAHKWLSDGQAPRRTEVERCLCINKALAHLEIARAALKAALRTQAAQEQKQEFAEGDSTND